MKRSISDESLSTQVAKRPKTDGKSDAKKVKSAGDLTHSQYQVADIYYERPYETVAREVAQDDTQKVANSNLNELGGHVENDFATEYQHKKFRKAMIQIRQNQPTEYLHKKFRRAQRLNMPSTEYFHKKFRRAERLQQMLQNKPFSYFHH